MVKKLLLLAGTMVALVVGVMLFAAFEIHHANINAHVENAVRLNTVKESFGTVFPEQQITSACTLDERDNLVISADNIIDDGKLNFAGSDGLNNTNDDRTPGNCIKISLSESFKGCDNADQDQKVDCPRGVVYKVSWADKQQGQGEHICPYIEVTDGDFEKPLSTSDGESNKITQNAGTFVRTYCVVDANGDLLPPVGTPPVDPNHIWNGQLTRTPRDHYDLWNLDFFVPVCDDKKPSGGLTLPKGMLETVPCVNHEVDLSSSLEFEVTQYKAKPPPD